MARIPRPPKEAPRATAKVQTNSAAADAAPSGAALLEPPAQVDLHSVSLMQVTSVSTGRVALARGSHDDFRPRDHKGCSALVGGLIPFFLAQAALPRHRCWRRR
jgi:hypothetical protein